MREFVNVGRMIISISRTARMTTAAPRKVRAFSATSEPADGLTGLRSESCTVTSRPNTFSNTPISSNLRWTSR